MSANFLGLPKVQFFDNNGNFLNAGKLYTYIPGGTTPKASYPTLADAIAATNANANPVILDSRGEATVVILGPVKLKLDSSTDSNIWTVDNVNLNHDMYDENGNELLKFVTQSNALNYLTIGNSATTDAVELATAGGDTDIDLEIDLRGAGELNILAPTNITGNTLVTGTLNVTGAATIPGYVPPVAFTIPGNASGGGSIRLSEDTDNGTNYVELKGAANIASNFTITQPAAQGAANTVAVNDGSGNMTFTTLSTLLGAVTSTVAVATGDLVQYRDISNSNVIAQATAQDIANLFVAKWELIQSQTAASVAQLDFTGLGSTYEELLIVFNKVVPATASAYINIQTGEGATPTWNTANYSKVEQTFDVAASGATTPTGNSKSSITLGEQGGATNGVNGWLLIQQPSSVAGSKGMNGQFNYDTGATLRAGWTFGAYQGSSNAFTGIRVKMSSGNISSGKVTLWGMRSS